MSKRVPSSRSRRLSDALKAASRDPIMIIRELEAALELQRRQSRDLAEKLEHHEATIEQQDSEIQQLDIENKRKEIEIKQRDIEIEQRKAELEESNAQRDSSRVLVAHLQEQVRALLAQRYGRKSEKLTAEQLGQLILAFGGDLKKDSELIPNQKPEDEGSPEPARKPRHKSKKRYKNGHPGRHKIGPHIERIVNNVLVDAEHRTCPSCNLDMECFKYVEHECLEYIPGKLVAHVERREVLGCKNATCKKSVVTAPSNCKGRKQSILGYSMIAQLIEKKCLDALPIDRQRDQWKRMGFEIHVNSLYSAWNWALDLLEIVGHTLLGDILNQPYVGVDDTGMTVLDRDAPGGSRRGHLWFFVDAFGRTGVKFTPTWAAKDIAPTILQIEGFVQVDDWKGYSSTVEDEDGQKRFLVDPNRRLACAMHIRRRFYEDFRLGGKKSQFALECWKRIYDIERRMKEKELSSEQRFGWRQEHSVPILQEFDTWVDQELLRVLPQSKFGKALRYAKNQREYMHRCMSDGRFEIDNGEPERQIRRPAMGRKNYLFTGSDRGGHRLATAYTLVLSCRALGIPVAAYLEDVLRKIDQGWPMRKLNQLMPGNWQGEELAGPGSTSNCG